MKKHHALTSKRLLQFMRQVLEPRIYETIEAIPVDAAYFEDPVTFGTAIAAGYERQTVPFRWGPAWSTAWFRLEFSLPENRDPEFCYGLFIQTGGEGCLRAESGDPVQGIDRFHPFYKIPAGTGKHHSFYLECCCAGFNGAATHNPERFQTRKIWDSEFTQADLVRIDQLYFRFATVFSSLFELLESLPDEEKVVERPHRGSLGLPVEEVVFRAELLYALNSAVNIFDPDSRTSWQEALELLESFIKKHPHAAGSPEMSIVGHSHIDVAWLWPLRETVRKCSRTFSSMCTYLEEYPEFVFSQGQAQLYKYTRENYPAVYEKIKRFVKEGRWEVASSMWVEPDCNLISGESLVRQIIHGKKFSMDEFGADVDFVWLPDVFGYSAAMPQILQKCGIKYFSTQKISWNQFNRFPHSTFIWKGIDGTGVFSHFLPSNCYNGLFTCGEMRFTAFNFNEKDRCSNILYSFGYGDGGGGVSREEIEKAKVINDVFGMPELKYDTIGNFFKKAEKNASDLPVWVGELYLELHRGTYTTHAWIKRANRKNEILLHSAESSSALFNSNNDYPYKGLADAWELLLLNQFHDIIPGSSIAWVYDDARKDHGKINNIGENIINKTLSDYGKTFSTEGMSRPVLAYNPTSWERDAIVEIDGVEIPVESITPYGCTVFDAAGKITPPSDETSVKTGRRSLENEFLKAEFDDSGRLAELIYKPAARNVITPGMKSNEFQLFEDIPANFDAWDIDIYYQEKQTILDGSVEWLESKSTPFAGTLKFRKPFGNSWIIQTARLCTGKKILEFHTEIEWSENRKLLKVAFPVDVLASRATYEIQFGHLERPTHENTSWEMAAFEVPAQKWADISENNFGMALLNDCKYGHDCIDNVLRLTLLRAPVEPDENADRGRHVFSYALMPHEGDFREAGVIREAYHFNVPLQMVSLDPGQKIDSGSSPGSMISCDKENIVIETVKRPEEGGNAIIIRAYESFQRRTSATFSFALPVESVSEVDMLERHCRNIDLEKGNSFTLDFKPFEIKTLRLECHS